MTEGDDDAGDCSFYITPVNICVCLLLISASMQQTVRDRKEKNKAFNNYSTRERWKDYS